MPPLRPPRVLALALSALALSAVTGCMGDPPPAPESAPLELVLDSCSLNRPSVKAGAHAMAIVGQGRVTLSDPKGNVVLTARGDEATPADLTLSAGTYGLACEPEGGRLGEAELRVDPAG